MKPSVMANATASAGTSTGNDSNDISQSNYGINIPINHEYGGGNMQQPSQQYYNYHPQQSNQQPQHQYNEGYGSPRTQQYTNQHPSQEHQMPTHFQQFGFDPEMDVDMFPRSRLGRMHDPFAGFGTTRKRSSFHDPLHPSIDGFSHYFDDPDFDFPQFSTMGRRRPGDSMVDDHDLFNRLPSEFRQFMPDGFTHRRTTGSGSMPTNINQQQQQQQQQPQQSSQPSQGYYSGNYIPTGNTPPATAGIPQSPSKKLCDAAIQTEDPNLSQGRSEIDGYSSTGQIHPDNLNHHGLRNTVDMGVKSAIENEMHGPRSHSAPPPEQQQQSQQHFQQQHPQKIPINGQRNTPPPAPNQSGQNIHTQYNTSQSTPPTTGGFQHPQSSAYYPKYNFSRQQHGASNQQKQQTPPPSQSPGATSYVRTIPIFVEGRQEPIINSHKEIPTQNESNGNVSASASANARAFTPPYQQQQQHPQQQQQQHRNYSQQQTHQHPNRPTPFNTQQSQSQAQPQAQTQAQFQPHHHPQYNQQQSQQNPQQSSQGLPPQTPHTMDSINKIQDIQRDVLDLMAKVEKFKGTRRDKEYVYLDEMLTRNLLKLDTIDTNGKESIRLARKEAIKCIQASINVLEAKAEENLKASQGNGNDNNSATITTTATTTTSATTNNTPTSTSSTYQENSQTKKDSSTSPKNSQNDIAAKAAQNQEQQGEDIIQQPNDATQIHEPIPLPPPESMQQPQGSATNNSNSESSPQKANNADLAQSSETPSSSNNESSSAESSIKTMESK